MKARVFVTLKPSVFDPQGRTIVEALHSLGHTAVSDVRQGKYFELDLAVATPAEAEQPCVDHRAGADDDGETEGVEGEDGGVGPEGRRLAHPRGDRGAFHPDEQAVHARGVSAAAAVLR